MKDVKAGLTDEQMSTIVEQSRQAVDAHCDSLPVEPSKEYSDACFYRAIEREVLARRASPAAAVPEGALPPLPELAEIKWRLENILERRQTAPTEKDARECLRLVAAVEADRAQQGEPVAVGKLNTARPFDDAFAQGYVQGWNECVDEHCRAATKAAAPADAWTFDEWLKLEEATNGCMGLSPLERDQMRMAFNAARAAPVPERAKAQPGIPTAGEVARKST